MSDPIRIPDKNKVIKLIGDLRSSDLSKISAQKMAITLTEQFQILPVITRQFLKGHHVVRVRLNETDNMFSSEKELSYRPDLNNITTYGRASVPLQSCFYGTIVSTNMVDALNTVLWEASQVFRDKNLETPEEFIFTISYWTVIEDMQVCEIVFCKKFIDSIPYIHEAYNNYLDGYRKQLAPEKVETIGLILQLYSDEFAKPQIERNTDYLISATYSQLAFDYQKIEAILYPSAQVDNQGINIAVTPFAVERKLKLDGAEMIRAIVKRGKRVGIPLKHTTSLGFLNTSFLWKDTPITQEMRDRMECFVRSE